MDLHTSYFITHNWSLRSVRTPDTISLSRSGSALHRHGRPRGDERLVMSNERSATPWFPSPPARPCPGGLSPHAGTQAVPRSRTQERGFIAVQRHERPRGDERLVMSNERSATPWFPSPPARPCPGGLSPHAGTQAVPRSRTQERGFISLQRHERHDLTSMSPR
jgi:hypothetical protein